MLRRSFLFSPTLFAAMPRLLAYEQWNVFTSKPFTGNQLAVFQDARGLTPEQMLAITREMNFSECSFLLPRTPAEDAKGHKVRIFTKESEVFFVGHPVLGTAMSIRAKKPGAGVTLELTGGSASVTFENTPEGVYGDMIQPKAVFAETHYPAVIAPMLGIRPPQIVESFPIQNVSTGRQNLIVMLDSLATMRSVYMNWPSIRTYFANGDKQRGFYLLTRETEDKAAQFHARKLTPTVEDPCSGSGAGPAAAYLVKLGIVPSGKRFIIEQGSEVHRPGRLYCQATKSGDTITQVRVGGYAVKVGGGAISL